MATSKKSFDFRMSKKVAELTQVVHMLFTRNHEKEIEIEALKDAYEDEIDRVIQDAQNKIKDLEKQLSNLSSQNATNTNGQKEVERLESIVKSKEEEWKKRLTMLELQLKNERLESQNARDLLIQAQQDVERLRENQNQNAATVNNETEKLNREIKLLESQIANLTKQLHESPSAETFKDLQLTHERTEKEFSAMKDMLSYSERKTEQLVSRNKLLEEQIKELKKELNKRNERKGAASKQDVSNAQTKASITDYTEEIVRLQNEIKRYRMELYNREGNFNRMFTDKNPIIIDRKIGKSTDGRLNFEAPHMRYTFSKQTRDRSMMLSSGNMAMQLSLNINGGRPPSQPTSHHSLDIAEISMQDLPELSGTRFRSPSANSTVSSASRLPHLGLDTRRRLSKPKPLPRELISTKES